MAAVQYDPEIRFYDLAKIIVILALLAAIALLAFWGIGRIEPSLNSRNIEVASGAPFLIEGQGQSGQRLRVYANSIELGLTTVSDTGLWTLMAEAPVEIGTYTVRIAQGEIGPRVVDYPGAIRVSEAPEMAGATEESAMAVEVEVAPTIELVEPIVMADGMTFEVNPDPLTNQAAFADGEEVLNGITAPGATVDVILDKVIVASTSADSNGTWQLPLTIEETGSHLLNISVVDADGVQLLVTDEVQIERYPAPTVEMLPDEAVEEGEIAFSGTAFAGSKVGIEVNGAIVDRAMTDDNGVWSWIGVIPAEGGYEVRPVMLDERDMPLVIGESLTISLPDGALVAEEAAVEDAAIEVEVVEEAADVEEATAEEVIEDAGAIVPTEVPAAVAATAAMVETLKLPDALASDGRFNTFYAGLDVTGNVYTLKLDEPFTIFAPTDTAFAALPERVLLGWRNNPDALRAVLLNHIVEGHRYVADIPFDEPVDNLNRGTIDFVSAESGIRANGAAIIDSDIEVANGVIHAVDQVMLPEFGATKPIIDSSGVATFEGRDLTVVGFADPGVNVILEMNGERFGTTTATWDGEFRVQGTIEPGEYNILAWIFDVDDVLLGVSEPVVLTVVE